MEISDIEGQAGAFNGFASVRVSGFDDIGQLVDAVREARTVVPESRVLITLDDIDQAAYTSMHAWEADDLEVPDDEWGAPSDGEQWDEAADERHELAQASRLARLLAERRGTVPLEGLAERLMTSERDVAALVKVNAEPNLLLDRVSHLLTVPVDADDLVLAGAPNGYFSGDLDVFANHALAWHLQQRHGYRLFGEGASWLGFERDHPLGQEEAAAVVADLISAYGAPDAPGWAELAQVIRGKDLLLLGYTENYVDL